MIKAPVNPGKSEAELRFPYKIDVPEPLGGFDVQLDAMREWCRRTVGSDAWAYHPHQDPKIRSAEGVPVRFARFYFERAKDADDFRRTWIKP